MSRLRLAGLRSMIGAAVLVGIGLPINTAQASEAGNFSVEQHFAAYKSICHDHAGNAKAQIAAAIANPYLLREIEPGANGARRFDGFDFTVSVLDNGDQRFCLVTTIVADTANLASGIAVADPVLSQGSTGNAHDVHTYVWTVKAANEPTVYIYYIGKKDGAMLASFGLGIEKAR